MLWRLPGNGRLGNRFANLDELAIVVLEDLTSKQAGAHASLELSTILVATTVGAILHSFNFLPATIDMADVESG